MHTRRSMSLVVMGVLITIGCGGSKPQEAAATAESERASMQLAQAPSEPSPAASAAGSATIRGTVAFSGTPPAPAKVKMDADPQCRLQHQDAVLAQEVIVNANGTLKNVFVYVKTGLEGKHFPAPAQPAKLDQHGCLYEPRVSGMRVNQPLEIVNSDATLHNVNCKPAKSKPFNIAQPVKGMKTTKTFTAPEVMIKCACNVHPWMSAYLGVLEHPFFGVTGEDGGFTLAGLPAGPYTLEAWHEKYGAQTQTVSVVDGESKSVSFEFKAQ